MATQAMEPPLFRMGKSARAHGRSLAKKHVQVTAVRGRLEQGRPGEETADPGVVKTVRWRARKSVHYVNIF